MSRLLEEAGIAWWLEPNREHGSTVVLTDRSEHAEPKLTLRYLDNPNGSLRNIAGILSERRNVMGLMPHPERASDPLLGSADGRVILQSMVNSLVSAAA